MNWFQGEIAQAITTSKAKQAIFVVYVFGNDEKSSRITELVNNEEVVKILGSDSFVAIKIEAESVPHQQFLQIYKLVPLPSIYFIGKQGVPIEIVTEISDVKSFQEKLNNILKKGGLSPISVQTQDLIKEESKVIPENVVCENGACTIKKVDQQPSSSQEKPDEKPDLSIEEKVERAKQLVEQKREEKKKEEFESERQKEIERRKAGQNVQQLKRWQDDQELKNLMEERQKERRETQAARERVLAQIAQDKAERAAKFSPPAPAPSTSQPAAPRPTNLNTARIQFRMPDGKTATNDFSSSEPLSTVHEYIKANLKLPFASYTLSTTFPRREFTDEDKASSLIELGLVPTAVILILPLNRGTVSTNPSGGLGGLMWSLLAPVFAILGYLKMFIFGSAPESGAQGRVDNQNKRTTDSSEQRGQPKIRRGGESTVVRRQGNVHRLSNRNDSDDENNTWNGNSTQQM